MRGASRVYRRHRGWLLHPVLAGASAMHSPHRGGHPSVVGCEEVVDALAGDAEDGGDVAEAAGDSGVEESLGDLATHHLGVRLGSGGFFVGDVDAVEEFADAGGPLDGRGVRTECRVEEAGD